MYKYQPKPNEIKLELGTRIGTTLLVPRPSPPQTAASPRCLLPPPPNVNSVWYLWDWNKLIPPGPPPARRLTRFGRSSVQAQHDISVPHQADGAGLAGQ